MSELDKKRTIATVALAIMVVVIAVLTWRGTFDAPSVGRDGGGLVGRVAPNAPSGRAVSMKPPLVGRVAPNAPTAADDGGLGTNLPTTSDDSDSSDPSDEETALVNAFDDMTDKWMEPSEGGVSMANVYAFADAFRRIPESRRMECLQRALNLVPDDNVMLLAGILMDKSLDGEYIEAVFNDVLNRGEDVKKPVLAEIYKDKTHPCWADVAWIFDATGEKEAMDAK